MSNEKQETIADIVREMRIFKCRNLETGELDLCNAIANYFADRLEAAWKRQEQVYLDQIRDVMNMLGHERYAAEHMKKPTVDNAADMREALECCDAIAQFPETRELQSIKDMRNIIQAALAAPPRNCDVYKTSWDVVTHWDGGLDSAQNIARMLDWLLAPAKSEAKGKIDGSK